MKQRKRNFTSEALRSTYVNLLKADDRRSKRKIREAEDELPAPEGGDSLDSQVDRYLAQYENEAKETPSTDTMESLDWRDLVKGVIIEAEGDEPADDADGAEAMGPAADEEPAKLSLDSIKVEDFVNSVVRLIENYDSLLEVRSTLIRRASSFLRKTYDAEVIDAFEKSLRDVHGMEAGKGSSEVDADKFPAPAADRALGGAQGGTGGAPV